MNPIEEQLITDHITNLQEQREKIIALIPEENGDFADSLARMIYSSERRSVERDIYTWKLLKKLLT
jgi:hypothetical protein